MSKRVPGFAALLVYALGVSALLTLGPIGCGSDTPPTGTQSQVAPEAVQANKNMEDFMKTQTKTKKAK